MQRVDRPVFKPSHCAAIPYIGQTAEGERWVDTGIEMPGFDNHVYLSETGIREAAQALGLVFVDDDAYSEDLTALDDARVQVEALQARVAELEPIEAAVRLIQGDE